MKIKLNLAFALLAVIPFLSCLMNGARKQNGFSLEKSGTKLSFPLNSNTKSSINVMYLFTDSSGKEYLTFQAPGQNDILFYSMDTREPELTVKPEVEGSNGVGFYTGYYIHTMDSIFITGSDAQEIILIGRDAKIINKYPYEESHDGVPLARYHAVSFVYKPVVFIDNKLYILPLCNRRAERNPVNACIDLSDNSVHALLGFEYPVFPGMTNPRKRSGLENDFSRCYDGRRFVYSFYYDEDIYITPVDQNNIDRKKVKSKYISQVKLLDDYAVTEKEMCENPNYGNLIYDKYRNVYYRIAYPATEVEDNIRMLELLMYGRKNFSIIILDQDFNVVGETLFPDYIYNSALMFIREDGLYICDSHPLNPDYSDDILSFQKFGLVPDK